MMGRMGKIGSPGRLALLLGALVLLGGGLAVAWLRYAPRHAPEGQPDLATLDASTLPGFRDTFNAHPDEIRLLVLLSPT
jgi:hypothetical protein